MQGVKPQLSPMQMKALDFWQASGFRSKAAALRMAGYGKSVVDQPQKVFGSLAVIRELTLRGLDEWGRRIPPQASVDDLPMPKHEPAALDFSKIDQKLLQELKQRLDYISAPKIEEVEFDTHPYTPTANVVDIFSAGTEQPQWVARGPSFSSM